MGNSTLQMNKKCEIISTFCADVKGYKSAMVIFQIKAATVFLIILFSGEIYSLEGWHGFY